MNGGRLERKMKDLEKKYQHDLCWPMRTNYTRSHCKENTLKISPIKCWTQNIVMKGI